MTVTNNFNIVLVEPEIPQNTGNIARLCACTNSNLYLVGKLGFSIDSRHVKRAGLDYWDSVNIQRIDTLEELWERFPENNFYYLTTKSNKLYTKEQFKEGDFFVFGPETRGLDERLLKEKADTAITIPMKEGERSLNLSNSVAVVVYEAIRQNG